MELGRIPNRLKKYRRIVGYSQKRVAILLALPNTSSLSRWEKGRSFPSIPILFKLSLLYKTQPFHLYQDLWQQLKNDIERREKDLFPQEEDTTNNEEYYL